MPFHTTNVIRWIGHLMTYVLYVYNLNIYNICPTSQYNKIPFKHAYKVPFTLEQFDNVVNGEAKVQTGANMKNLHLTLVERVRCSVKSKRLR